MSNIIISERNEEGFSAILEAFQSAIETDVIPMSSFSVEPGDSEKTVQIEAKVHVPSAKRIIVRDKVVDYLDRLIDNGQLDSLGVISGTEKNPRKEQFDLILRKDGKKSQIIRILIKPLLIYLIFLDYFLIMSPTLKGKLFFLRSSKK